MVGLAEAAAEKTMVRSHKGIGGAFVVDVITNGKSGVAVQLEGSSFETVWQLKEGGEDGILDLNKVRKQLVWVVFYVVVCVVHVCFFSCVVRCCFFCFFLRLCCVYAFNVVLLLFYSVDCVSCGLICG